jgi:hypothetical protein
MHEISESWYSPPEELAEHAHLPSEETYWDGGKRNNNGSAKEEKAEEAVIPYSDEERLNRLPWHVPIAQPAPKKRFMSDRLDAYARFRDDLDGKRMAFRAWRRMVVDHGLSYPYAKELFAREIVPTKVSDKYKNFKELDKAKKRKYLVAGAAGALALGAAYAAHKYGLNPFANVDDHAHVAAAVPMPKTHSLVDHWQSYRGNNVANTALVDSHAHSKTEATRQTFGHERLRKFGDTLWHHAQTDLKHKLHRDPTNAQVEKLTGKILKYNHWTWEKAHHLPIGQVFKAPKIF